MDVIVSMIVFMLVIVSTISPVKYVFTIKNTAILSYKVHHGGWTQGAGQTNQDLLFPSWHLRSAWHITYGARGWAYAWPLAASYVLG